MSAGHLRATCVRVTGAPPVRLIHECLIREAKRRLLGSALPIGAIALELGFEDAAYFSRLFPCQVRHAATTVSVVFQAECIPMPRPSLTHTHSLQPIARDTLQERVYLRIRQALIHSEFKPGQVLTIRELAQKLGTSIMPVREALQKLTVERVLELLPTRSVRVPVLSAEEFAEICEARMLLEGHMARLAAERATRPTSSGSSRRAARSSPPRCRARRPSSSRGTATFTLPSTRRPASRRCWS